MTLPSDRVQQNPVLFAAALRTEPKVQTMLDNHSTTELPHEPFYVLKVSLGFLEWL